MKEFIKNLKGKKVLSFVLAAIMLVTTFSVAVPVLKLDTNAAEMTYDGEGNIIIDGVTQKQIVTKDNATANLNTSKYDEYAASYLGGASYSTGIVIPGLDPAQDYVIQGMTYYPKRDWFLVTAYHNVADGETTQSSKVFALDASTGEFVAMFSFLNTDGSVNTDHGGGIAVSEHNLYYSCGDKDRSIAYVPLSKLEEAPLNAHTQLQLVDELEFVEIGSVSSDSKTAYSAYVCYDEGILWMGNFYDKGASAIGITIAAADYNCPSNNTYNSMVFGYKLAGNSSAEEWAHLKGTFKNLASVATASGTGTSNDSTHTWNAYQNGTNINITGSITAPTAYVGEFTGSFGSVTLTEGVNYTIEFKSTNRSTDMYMFSPAGTHCNVKQSSQTTITQLPDGRYHYVMNFTAGLKPANADSTWPTTQNADGSYTGTYTIRFDQDAIQAGEAREYAITDVKISQKNTHENAESVVDEGYAGSPSYALGLNNNLKDVQYATVHEGKLYLSRSYGSGAGNSINFGFGETSFLTVADIDLSQPGDKPVIISTTSTGSLDKTINAYDISNYQDYPMMPMSEGLCVVGGEIFITFEGASNKYLNESSGLTSIGNCEKPVDVIWQLDPYELMEQEVAEPEKSIYYEKVNSVSEIESGAEYIIVHQSPEKDPVTQEQILYALNADGNFKGYKLSKGTASVVKGYNGMIGHAITDYDLVDEDNNGSAEKLYLNDPDKDDVENIRWTLTKVDGTNYRITTTEPYFANCNNLYFDANTISMLPGNATEFLKNIKLMDSGNGKGGIWLSNSDTFFLWSNDGVKEDYNNKINSYYIRNSGTTAMYSGIYEQPGTFHCDALNLSGSNIIGDSVPGANSYSDGVFYLFKRKVDETASTYESRVYTGMNAKLQADGTYTVELETYAISPNHYKYVGEKPTDYIIVADTSESMASTGSTGISGFSATDELAVNALCSEDDTKTPASTTGIHGFAYKNPSQDIFYLHSDGKYYQIYLAIHTLSVNLFNNPNNQSYWAYFIDSDGRYHVLSADGGFKVSGITEEEFQTYVANDQNYSNYSKSTSNGTRQDVVVYKGVHYRFDNVNSQYATEHTRISTLKNAVSNLVGQIAEENSQNRIALVQFGADASTGYYNTSSTLINTGYADALWSAGNASGLQTIASNLTTSAQTTNNIAFPIVNSIIANSGATYVGENSTRNVAVIYLSDGVAGADGQSDEQYKAAANEIIPEALKTKQAGAFIYTVMIGADGTQYGRNTFMEAISSKYAEAASMTDLGGQSVDGVNYNLSLATATINNFVNFGAVTLKETSANNAVGLESLNASAFLREQLSKAFKFPASTDDYTVKVELVPGVFDKIGRFAFDEDNVIEQSNVDDENDTDVDWDVDTTNRTITVTEYNYAEQYIAKNRTTPGNKLRVTITGLLINETEKIQNTSINDIATTGIYKTSGDMTANNAFKLLPTEYFNIPEYTYVLDYDLPMLDTAVNGTLLSVDGTPAKQSTYKTARSTADVELTFVDSEQNMTYELNSGVYTTTDNTSYCLIDREDGTYDWFKINIIPASNVLFEETRFTSVEKENTAKWTSDGSAINIYQSLSDENDRYGYDEDFKDNGVGYSNGTVKKATVNSTTKRSETMQFQYTGTGFDLMSACGANTGILMVSVKNSGGTLEKLLLVDTYYNDGNATLLKQVPVVSYTNAAGHGTYSVDVAGAYLSSAQGVTGGRSVSTNPLLGGLLNSFSTKAEGYTVESLLEEFDIDIPADEVELIWFDDNSVLNGGTGPASAGSKARSTTPVNASLDCYVDSIRTYNPLQDQSRYIDSEKGAKYYNIIDELATADENGVIKAPDGETSLFAYVTGTFETDDEGNTPTLSFANYQSVGPQHELYLAKATDAADSHAVSFKVTVPTADSRVMISLRAVDGATTAKVASGESYQFDINTATEQYFDITPYLDTNDAGVATVTVTNVGDGLLSVNNLKTTGNATVAAISDEDLPVMAMALAAEPITVDDPNAYDYNAPVEEDVQEPETDAPAEDDTPEADEPVTDVPMDLTSIIKMLLKFIETIILKFF